MSVTPARRAALDVLRAVRRGELLDRALAAALDDLPPRDRPWTQELVFGTVRLRGRLDFLLEQRVRRGLAGLEPDVLDVLRLGSYQLLEMDSVPAYAAVSQAVELASAVGGRGAGGLVNAVLQRLARDAEPEHLPDFDRDPAGWLAAWGSHPDWLVRRWLDRFGREDARALVEANNRRPELYIRPVGMAVAEARSALDAAGIEAEPVPFARESLRLPRPATAAQALAAVPAVVQDPAATLVVRFAAVPPGRRWADLCAAPGGKALALAEDVRYLLAADVSAGRIERVRENARRIGGLPLGLVVADARDPPLRPLDAVLVDVPCTGTGTLRRHPDGKWRLRPADLDSLVALQRQILDGAAEAVAPGGLLVYATCSLEPEENEEQVDAFLAQYPDFVPEPTPAALDPALLDPRGRLLVLPQRFGVDGAFAVRLRRR